MQPTTLKSSQADVLNRIANDPAVLEQMRLQWVDLSGFYLRPKNVALGGESGVALFGYRGRGVYEGHYLFPPAVRGKEALAQCRAFLHTMFTNYRASLIIGEVPIENRAARHFTNALGFTRQGVSVIQGRSCVVYHMERATWEVLSAG